MAISALFVVLGALAPFASADSTPPLAFSYLWHLQQPIYWPAIDPGSPATHPTYQRAAQSLKLRDTVNHGHPENDLDQIFSKADRVAIYQTRAVDAINSVSSSATFGAQMTYPGDLIDNVASLAENGQQYGYTDGWNATYAMALRTQRTAAGYKRLDIVNFPYHHAFAPLIDPEMLEMEILINQVAYNDTWGPQAGISSGFFPPEMSFSERIIPTLARLGIKWVIVANNHLSRATTNYTFSTSGDNNDPPNRADQTNPAQAQWFAKQVDRGCRPNNAVPFSFLPHWVTHTDPDTGEEARIVAVPSAMAMSWSDSESCYSTSDMDAIVAQAAAAGQQGRPLYVLLAHDGDNAFSGGYSYYMQCVSQLVSEGAGKGYQPMPVEEYLAKYPVPETDVAHVEDGAWINHDSDFGDPQWIWGWAGVLRDQNGTYNVEGGWDCNQRAWAIIAASQNWVSTARQVAGGTLRPDQVRLPGADATAAEIAWHFHLVQPSGWLYYGCPNLDMADKVALAANTAMEWAAKVAKPGDASDKTAPTISTVQRWPYNPGAYGAGAKWQYKLTQMPRDFHVFAFVHDISSVASTTLYMRTDSDRAVGPENKLRNPAALGARSPGLSDWQAVPMTQRAFPGGDIWNVHFNVTPTAIADLAYAHITGLCDVLVDYYVEAADSLGNVRKSDLYHVYVGAGNSTCDGSKAFL